MNYLLIGIDPARKAGIAAAVYNAHGERITPYHCKALALEQGEKWDIVTEIYALLARCGSEDEIAFVFCVESYPRCWQFSACNAKSNLIVKQLKSEFKRRNGRKWDYPTIIKASARGGDWYKKLGYKSAAFKSESTKDFAKSYAEKFLKVRTPDLTEDEVDAILLAYYGANEFFAKAKP